MQSTAKPRYIIGIDEVGRGPLAGPVTVGAVMLPVAYNRRLLRGVRDSKKLPPHERARWATHARVAAARGDLRFAISSVSAPIIDRRGIVYATHTALNRTLARLKARPSECLVLLDGGLRAPEAFIHQQTIVHGDDREPAIALASIIAKVHRDTKMERFSKRFPNYAFDKHKGYGTKLHHRAILKHGPCALHRVSFLH